MNIPFQAYEGSEPYVFVSYAHKNAEVVFALLKRLNSDEFRVWYDEGIEPGSKFAAQLFKKIRECSAFLVFLSSDSIASMHVVSEIGAAFDNRKKIIPVLLESNLTLPDEIKYCIGTLHQSARYGSDDDDDAFYQKLTDSMPDETRDSVKVSDGVLKKCKENSRIVTIPKEVHTIGESSFKNCLSLKKVDIGNGVSVIKDEAFRGCQQLQRIDLPTSVKSVGDSAFRDCISLSELVVYPAECGMTEIGERAFENCTSLRNISLPTSLSEIYGGTFNSCKALEQITIPNSVTIIGENSFGDCHNLRKISLPESLTKIDDLAFDGCRALTEIVLSDGLTKIGKNAFKDCHNLQGVSLGKGVSKIGASPFRGCTMLRTIHVAPANRYFKSVDDTLFNKNKSILVCYPAMKAGDVYEVPDSVTEICEWAFSECNNLERIVIPDSVTEIGEGAFFRCRKLRSMELPESVEKIDDTAFRGCESLELVVMPDSLREIGWGLFSGCSSSLTVECSQNSHAEKYCKMRNIRYQIRQQEA